MIRIAIIAAFAAICYRWGDWKNWKQYQPAILFAIIGDLIYKVVFHNYTLWKYTGWPNDTFSNFSYMFFVYPSAIILFLSKFPKTRGKAILYVVLISAVGSAMEWLSCQFGFFAYDHSWNLLHSFWFFIAGFSLIKLHYHHPLLAWPAAFVLLSFVMIVFKVPLAIIK